MNSCSKDPVVDDIIKGVVKLTTVINFWNYNKKKIG